MAFERLKYALLYRIGFTPWDGHVLPVRLHELIDGSPALRTGAGRWMWDAAPAIRRSTSRATTAGT